LSGCVMTFVAELRRYLCPYETILQSPRPNFSAMIF
jgi:hypothetical protein